MEYETFIEHTGCMYVLGVRTESLEMNVEQELKTLNFHGLNMSCKINVFRRIHTLAFYLPE